MIPCIRGCMRYRKHYSDCPAQDGRDGAWLPWQPTFDRDELFDADLRRGWYLELARTVHATRAGDLDVWHRCPGCLPVEAKHGLLCESCHLRLADRLKSPMPYDTASGHRKYNLAKGSLIWAFQHIAGDLAPGRGSGEKVTTSRTPPAAASLGILDLRREILAEVGAWLSATCRAFGLHGPDWWRMRVDEASRRAWAPQDSAELADAIRYISTWLDRVETLPGVVQLYDASERLLSRVAAVAPWEARPRKLRGIACPECDRDALAVFEGSDNVTCRRCRAVFGRERYDIWSEMAEAERAAS